MYKTKKDFEGKIERFKATLTAIGFAPKEEVNCNEIFSQVSLKDSFRVIMTLMVHLDMELHQMGVKNCFSK